MNAILRTLVPFGLAVISLHAADPASPPAASSEKDKPGTDAAALEAKFKATLTEATFNGRWCLLEGDKLGPDKDEKYTITGVEKKSDSEWIISARIQYAAFNFVAPVPVKVKWAGDTPVIIVDNVGFPGTAKYSARVMIYGDTYAGSWSGGGHGGMLHGVITRTKPASAPDEKQPAK